MRTGPGNKKAVWGWVLYDWANSAFATTVMAGFFPVFFKQYWSFGADINMSSARLGFGNAVAGLVVALMAPILGAVADRGGSRKKFLIIFAYLGVLMSGGLFFVQRGQWLLAVFIYGFGVIGFSGANIFYDALLPHVTADDRIDSVSGLGYAMGYLGGGLLFLVNVMMTMMPEKFGLADAGQAVRFAFVSVAIWWGGFSIFMMVWVVETKTPDIPETVSPLLRDAIRQLVRTCRQIRKRRSLLLFLAAYWCYIDGVDTVIRMAVDYGMSLGFRAKDLILALLMVQFIGFPAALGFGNLGQRWGVRKAIFLTLGVYMLVTVWAALMTQKEEFFILAGLIGLVQGGVQALSRSYYARLIPLEQTAEFFGFYNMMGRFATIMGPALMGGVALLVRKSLMPLTPSVAQIQAVGHLASRWSIASVLVLFALGGILFWFADEKRDAPFRSGPGFHIKG